MLIDAMTPIISQHIRVRHPQHFAVGEHSIVDDFCYFSTRVHIGRCSHIASGCSVAGGGERYFELGDYCSLSSGVKIWCTSDDFVNDLVTIIPGNYPEIKQHVISGDVIFENYTAVGSNAVVMPNNRIPVGTVIGALSFVPPAFDFRPWSVYAGTPIRYLRPRNRPSVEEQIRKLDALLQGSKE